MAWIENNDVEGLELDFTDGLDHTEHDAGDDDGEEDVSPMEGAPRTFALTDVLSASDEARAVATGAASSWSRAAKIEPSRPRIGTSSWKRARLSVAGVAAGAYQPWRGA